MSKKYIIIPIIFNAIKALNIEIKESLKLYIENIIKGVNIVKQ